MPKPRLPRKVTTPRRDTSLNDRQERFARAYAASLDRLGALREAGYEFVDDDSGYSMASRLLAHVKVRALVDDILSTIAAKYGMDAEGTVSRLKFVYLQAVDDGDWAAAVSALKELGKHYGIYEKDHKQKKYSREDVEKMKVQLEANGFDWTRANFPSTN